MNKMNKMNNLFIFFWNYSKLNVVISIFMLLLSQFFLIISYFLPIKVIVILSNNNISDHLKKIFFNFPDNDIILILTFFVFIFYSLHIVMEKYLIFFTYAIMNNIFNTKYKVINTKNRFIYTYIDSFLKFITILIFLTILLLTVIYLFFLIGVAILSYLIFVLFIVTKVKVNSHAYFLKIASGLGFMLVFILEVIDMLYIKTQDISITTIVLVLIISRYIFIRGPYMMNKLIFLYINMDKFYKKINDSKL